MFTHIMFTYIWCYYILPCALLHHDISYYKFALYYIIIPHIISSAYIRLNHTTCFIIISRITQYCPILSQIIQFHYIRLNYMTLYYVNISYCVAYYYCSLNFFFTVSFFFFFLLYFLLYLLIYFYCINFSMSFIGMNVR